MTTGSAGPTRPDAFLKWLKGSGVDLVAVNDGRVAKMAEIFTP
jgi:hypothetical protein